MNRLVKGVCALTIAVFVGMAGMTAVGISPLAQLSSIDGPVGGDNPNPPPQDGGGGCV
jgi:hypothetical protein